MNKRENVDLKHLNSSKGFLENLNHMDYIRKDIEQCNLNKKRKMIWLLICLVIKKRNPIVTELFLRDRNLNFSLILILHDLVFLYQKNIRLNATHCFIKKIPNKQELQPIAFNNSSDIDFKDFTNLYKKCTIKPYFLTYWCYSCIR